MSDLNIKHYLTNLKLVERNREWLSAANITVMEKATYYASIGRSYIEGAKSISYLGKRFYFDNPATPLNLQNYPYEISNKILHNMDMTPKSVLDIGANIGQFSMTMGHILGTDALVDAFEPNPHAFEYLKRNSSTAKHRMRVFNFGVGPNEERVNIYYNPSRSGIGSLIKNNAGAGPVVSAEIAISNRPETLTRRKNYDLIKIDVEGFEFEVLKALGGLKPKYLFIEISGMGREKNYLHSELLKLVESMWGPYDACYIGGYKRKSTTFDMLLKFSNKKI